MYIHPKFTHIIAIFKQLLHHFISCMKINRRIEYKSIILATANIEPVYLYDIIPLQRDPGADSMTY